MIPDFSDTCAQMLGITLDQYDDLTDPLEDFLTEELPDGEPRLWKWYNTICLL